MDMDAEMVGALVFGLYAISGLFVIFAPD